MLPLEKLTKEARLGFEKQGIDTAALDIALELELDLDLDDGNFGEIWLALTVKKRNSTLCP